MLIRKLRNIVKTTLLPMGVAVGLGAACTPKSGSTLESSTKKLVMVTSPDSPPFEFFDEKKNEILGFDIDVGREIAERLGYEFVVIGTEFNSLIPTLLSGRADLAIANLSPTEERRKSFDFSRPYFKFTSMFLVAKGSGVNSAADLRGKKIGAQLSSTHEEHVKKLAESVGGETVLRNELLQIVQELKSGRIDIALMERTAAKNFSKQNSDLVAFDTEIGAEDCIIGFRKGSPLLDEVNRVVDEMKADGSITRLGAKWF